MTTIDTLKLEAARVMIAERERYEVAPYLNGERGVFPKVKSIRVALILGTETACGLWIEQRVMESFCRWMGKNWWQCPDLIGMKFWEDMLALSGEVA